jgi:hypothetical protein
MSGGMQTMAGMLLDYTYKGPNGDYYTGQVVADPTVARFAYQPGGVYSVGGGTYTIGTTQTPTNAPVGSVYQTSYYDAATGKTYDSYHYDPKNNAYYDVKADGYDKSTGMYTPPGSTTGVPMWSTKDGLGSEFAYVKDAADTYRVYGGGGTAYAHINAPITAPAAYDYKFMYPDGAYYLGRVVDDGTFGYKAGGTYPKGVGTYTITGVDPVKPDSTALAGYNYTTSYVDASGTQYSAEDTDKSSPYYEKPTGYGGLGTEHDYIHKPTGYYAYSAFTEASQSTPVTAIPLPT